jgi:hypothetical protein
MQQGETYLTAGELSLAFEHMGLRGWSEHRCRKLIRAMRQTGAPAVGGRYVRASEAHEWLRTNPHWHAYGRERVQPGVLS